MGQRVRELIANPEENTNRGSHRVTLRDLVSSALRGTWPKIVIIVFVLELAFLFFGSTIPIPQSLVNQISSQNSATAQTAASLDLVGRAVYLFSNNFGIALYEFVPILGWFYFGLSLYSTALAIEVIGITSNLPGPLVTFSLLLQPHTWLELPAYAIATTQSFYLLSTVARRSKFKFEVARTGLVLGVVAAELFIAALFESSEISLLSYGLLADFAIPWLLFAVLVLSLYLGRKQILKGYRSDAILQPLPMPPLQQQQLSSPWSRPNPSRFCSKCGAKIHNPQGALFCDQCGQRLNQPTVGGGYSSSAEVPASPPPHS